MAITDDPWAGLRGPVKQQQPQPQPKRPGLDMFAGADEDGSFREMLGRLGPVLMMMDPMSANAGAAMAQLQQGRRDERLKKRSRNETAQWLLSEGVGEGEARYLTSNPTALNAWYTEWKNSGKPDWQLKELYNAKGEKQNYMVDMKTGNMSPIGGAAKTAPNVTIETIYDEKGNEQKVLVNKDDPYAEPIPIGGAKSDVLSPEAEQQKIRLAEAGRASSTVSVNTKGETEQAKVTGGEKGYGGYYNQLQTTARAAPKALGTLTLMEDAVRQPGFSAGGAGPFMLKAKQWAKSLGYDPEGLGDMEAFNSLSKTMVMDSLGSLGTGISSTDRVFIEEMMPGLGTSRGGNLALIEMQRVSLKRNMEVAKMAREYRRTHEGLIDEGFDEQLAEWTEGSDSMPAHPVYSKADIARINQLKLTPDDPQQVGGGGEGGKGDKTAVPDENGWVDVQGMPGVKMRIGETPPAVVDPISPAPPAIERPTVPEIPPIVPRVGQPNPLRFGR